MRRWVAPGPKISKQLMGIAGSFQNRAEQEQGRGWSRARAEQSKSRGGALGTAAAEQGAPLLAHRCTTRDAPKVPNLETHSTEPPNLQYPTSRPMVPDLQT